LTVGLLGLFDVTKPGIVAAATLAVLSLIVFDLLLDRRQLRRIEGFLGGLAESVRSAGRPASIDHVLADSVPWSRLRTAGATDIRLIGVTLNRTVRSHLEELKRQLDAGAVIRIAVIDPAGDAPAEAARRNGLGTAAEIFEHRVQPTLDLLAYLGGDPANPGRLEVRLLPFVPAFGLGLIDPAAPEGQGWVDIYSHRPDGREAVILLEADRDPRWYQHFVREFDRIWANGRPLALDLPPPASREAARFTTLA
jgi:hypothetical protein